MGNVLTNELRQLLGEVLAKCQRDEASLKVEEKTKDRDARMVAFALFNRGISSAKGFLLLDRDLPIEARTLARNCLESAIWLRALSANPEKTLHVLDRDGVHSHKARIENMLKLIGAPFELSSKDKPGSMLAELKKIRQNIAEKNVTERERAKLEKLVQIGDSDEMYFHYRMLSDDASHISNRSILEHLKLALEKRGHSVMDHLDESTHLLAFYPIIQALLDCQSEILKIYGLETDETHQNQLHDLMTTRNMNGEKITNNDENLES